MCCPNNLRLGVLVNIKNIGMQSKVYRTILNGLVGSIVLGKSRMSAITYHGNRHARSCSFV